MRIGRVLLTAVATAAALLLSPCMAKAEDCRLGASATCFDLGNRLELRGGWGEWIGGGLLLRHVVTTEDPGITWRLEHGITAASWDGDATRGALYRGRYQRHARDGHLVLPTSPPKKLWLPFDVGAEADLGSFVIPEGAARAELGVVRAGFVFDLLRSSTFRRRLGVGAVARWDLSLADPALTHLPGVDEHRVAPLSQGLLVFHAESEDGLGVLDARVEAGPTWSSASGWRNELRAELSLERVLVAFNDQPLAPYLRLGWEDPGRGGYLAAGLSLSLGASTRRPR